MKRPSLKLFLLFALALLPLQGMAQNSAVTGTVSDQTGAVIPQAKITLVNTTTNVSYQATSKTDGTYLIVDVAPGSGYKINCSHAGFQPEAITDITMSVGVTRTQNIRMAVGTENTTVEVSATSSEVTLNTVDATIGNNIDVQELQQMPVYDRTAGITTLFTQQAGVEPASQSVAGARIDQSNVTVDGLDVGDLRGGTGFTITSPTPVDSIEQFTGSVAGLGAGTGTGSGGQFQLVTKSGSNTFHGNLNEYNRNTDMVANTWFGNLNGVPRAPYIQNQFGGNLGGPIKRDKLFFFFNLTDSRIDTSAFTEPSVFLPSFLAGNLNYINNSSNNCGNSTRLTSAASNPCISTLSSAGVAALDPQGIGFDPAMLAYFQKRYGGAITAQGGNLDYTAGDGINSAGLPFNSKTPNNSSDYTVRLDYNLTAAQKLSAIASLYRQNNSYIQWFPGDPSGSAATRAYRYVLSHVWNLGGNKVNQFTFGQTVNKGLSLTPNYSPTGYTVFEPSDFGAAGMFGPTAPYPVPYNAGNRQAVPVFRDDFNWLRKSHTLTAGVTFKPITIDQGVNNDNTVVTLGVNGFTNPLVGGLDPTLRPQNINCSANCTAQGEYDQLFPLALGEVNFANSTLNFNAKGQPLASGAPVSFNYRYYETEAYVGDSWKVTPHLTLSYGLRYQYYSVPYEVNGLESVPVFAGTNKPVDFDQYLSARQASAKAGQFNNTSVPLVSYVLGGKANHGPSQYKPNTMDFAPRFAFSYSPLKTQNTIVNGSVGLVYDRNVMGAVNNYQSNYSFLFQNSAATTFPGTTSTQQLMTNPRVGANMALPANTINQPAAPTAPYTPYVQNGVPCGFTGCASIPTYTISPTLKDPYAIAINFGIQQALPDHMILKVNYVGRLGRRNLAVADPAGLINVADTTGKSTQNLSQAFAGLTADERANGGNVTQIQPWFEDMLGPMQSGAGVANSNTAIVASNAGGAILRGDLVDAINGNAWDTALWPTNLGVAMQFSADGYLTNKGSSNYDGLLVTLDKNISHGLRYEFNYTWSHSIDNASQPPASNTISFQIGMICDATQPRACRGSSDFDVRQVVNSNFLYQLPVGRGKSLAGNSPRWLDEAIGGWTLSGTPTYRTGVTVPTTGFTYFSSYNNQPPPIFCVAGDTKCLGTPGNGIIGSRNDLKVKVNFEKATNQLWSYAGGQAGANKAVNDFRGPEGIEYGQRNILRGPHAFTMDAGLGKTFAVLPSDRLNAIFRADAFNVFNHPVFNGGNGGSLSAANGSTNGGGQDIVLDSGNFGEIYGTQSGSSGQGSRVLQVSLRLQF